MRRRPAIRARRGRHEVAELNRKALDDYDNLNFDDAKAVLKNALALCDKNGLGSDPVRAQTYLNLGVVLLAADAQHRDGAVANLRRAIQIQADIKLPERLANPEVQQAFVEAQTSVRATQSTQAPASTGGCGHRPRVEARGSPPAMKTKRSKLPPSHRRVGSTRAGSSALASAAASGGPAAPAR